MAQCASRKRAREEEEEEEERTCWLCSEFGCIEGEDDGPLVQPCACRGSIKWIHKHCLDELRRDSPKEDAAYRCGQCMDEYHDALSIELLSARLQAERTDGKEISCTLDALAQELQAQGKYDEAEPLYREALKMDRTALGSRHPNTLTAINNLVQLLQFKDDTFAAAEPLLRELLQSRRKTLGDRHPDTLSSINDLGQLLLDEGDRAAAEPLFCEALKARRETLGIRHPSTLNSTNTLGNLLKAKGELSAAEPLLRKTLEVYRETLGSRHPVTLVAMNNLGQLLEGKGNLDGALGSNAPPPAVTSQPRIRLYVAGSHVKQPRQPVGVTPQEAEVKWRALLQGAEQSAKPFFRETVEGLPVTVAPSGSIICARALQKV